MLPAGLSSLPSPIPSRLSAFRPLSRDTSNASSSNSAPSVGPQPVPAAPLFPQPGSMPVSVHIPVPVFPSRTQSFFVVDPQVYQQQLFTQLSQGLIQKNKNIVLSALDAGVSLQVEPSLGGETPLIFAVELGWWDCVGKMLSAQPPATWFRAVSASGRGDTVLLAALRHGCPHPLAAKIFECCPPEFVSFQNSFGETALLLAIENNYGELSQLIWGVCRLNGQIEAVVNAISTKTGKTVLICALEKKRVFLAQLILQHMTAAAAIDAVTKDGHTALMCAIKAADARQLGLVEAIFYKSSRSTLSAITRQGWTALSYAVERGFFKLAKDILFWNPYNTSSLDAVAWDGVSGGRTVLMWSILMGDGDFAAELLEKSRVESVSHVNRHDGTALILAIERDFFELAGKILERSTCEAVGAVCLGYCTAFEAAIAKKQNDLALRILRKTPVLSLNIIRPTITLGEGMTSLLAVVVYGARDIIPQLLPLLTLKVLITPFGGLTAGVMARRMAERQTESLELRQSWARVADEIRDRVIICFAAERILRNPAPLSLNAAMRAIKTFVLSCPEYSLVQTSGEAYLNSLDSLDALARAVENKDSRLNGYVDFCMPNPCH